MISRLKAIFWVACFIPFGQLLYNGFTDNLGANPIEAITRFTGSWTLIFLLATLAISPLRRISGWNHLITLRRMFGLFAFFYACLHFSTFLVLDHFFDLQAIGKDVLKRPFVTAGFTAFLLMVPLAVTSTRGMIRRLGKRWQQLHRLLARKGRHPAPRHVWRSPRLAPGLSAFHDLVAVCVEPVFWQLLPSALSIP
jgi:sulfoxide reductase heme-binding subunit YedZ